MAKRAARKRPGDLVEMACRLSDYCKDCPTREGVAGRWRALFYRVLREECGFNRAACRALWDGLAQGNWKHLRMSGDEEGLSADEWLERFAGDVLYCSDRWSIDRLTRCHWTFRRWLAALDAKGSECESTGAEGDAYERRLREALEESREDYAEGRTVQSREDLASAVELKRDEGAARDERRRREIARVLNSQGIRCTPDSTVIRNAVERHR